MIFLYPLAMGITGGTLSSGPQGSRRLSIVRLPQCLDQLGLGHRRAALNAKSSGQLVQVPLGSIRVDTARGWTVRVDTTLGLLVGRAGALLRFPAVRDLLMRVLEGAESHPMC